MRFGTECGYHEITSLPGNPSIAVSHAVCIHKQYRGNGIGKKEAKERLDQLRKMGYVAAIATVVVGNIPQEKIMSSLGWKPVTSELETPHTNNKYKIWQICL